MELRRRAESAVQFPNSQQLSELLRARAASAPGLVRTTPLPMPAAKRRLCERERWAGGHVPDDGRVELRGVDVDDVKRSADGQLPQQRQGPAVHHRKHTCV